MRDLSGQEFNGGRYRVLQPLGHEGGMGSLWVAEDTRMSTKVAIKFPLEGILEQDGFRERFQNEIRVLIDLCSRHANIVKITDKSSEGEDPYLVMQLLNGGSLRDWSNRLHQRPLHNLDWRRTLRWLEDVSDALDFMHGNRCVHRDIKPQNILFDESRKVYLADFGIAKLLSETTGSGSYRSVTRTTQVIGTLPYMAPEVLKSNSISGHSDQYSLAVTLYEVLSGKLPFHGYSEIDIHEAQKVAPEPLHHLFPYISPLASTVIERALSFHPSHRYETCLAFAGALLDCVAKTKSAPQSEPTPQVDIIVAEEVDSIVEPAPSTPPTSPIASGGAETASNRPIPPGQAPSQHPDIKLEQKTVQVPELVGSAVAPAKPKTGGNLFTRLFPGVKPQPQATPPSFIPPRPGPPSVPPPLSGPGPKQNPPTFSHQRERKLVSCPWCWHKFSRADILWIAEHPDLHGDSKLGDELHRFLPEKYTADCRAIDAMGMVCRRMACPNCHLVVPRDFVDFEPIFVSVLGVPTSGKSCLMASMTWQLRKNLPQKFRFDFSDADSELNQSIVKNEQSMFLNSTNALVRLRKTDLAGPEDGYVSVQHGEREVTYLRPHVFSLRPSPNHPNFHAASTISYALCLYDNAGEHFLPGSERSEKPVTRHLASSEAIIFVFDPSQHPKFREKCFQSTSDPQFLQDSMNATIRQETVLVEAMNRIRTFGNLSLHGRYEKPLVVLLNKYDAWASAFGGRRLPEPWLQTDPNYPASLDAPKLAKISGQFRNLMSNLCPEVVAAAENLSSQVIYLPSSAFGRPVEVEGDTNGVRANRLNPMWAEVPMLHILSVIRRGVIPRRVS